MKMTRLFLLLTSLFYVYLVQAQVKIIVNVSKAGKFKKEVATAMKTQAQGKELGEVTSLTITGELNDADRTFIAENLTNVEVLDLSGLSNIEDFPVPLHSVKELRLPPTIPQPTKETKTDRMSILLKGYAQDKKIMHKDNVDVSLFPSLQTLYTVKPRIEGDVLSRIPHVYIGKLNTQYPDITFHENVTEIVFSTTSEFLEAMKEHSPVQNKEIGYIHETGEMHLLKWTPTIPDEVMREVTDIAENAFYQHRDEVKTLNLPNLKVLRTNCLSLCRALESVTFASLTEIGNSAFSNTSIKHLVFPVSLQNISYNFAEGSRLQSIEFQSTEAPAITTTSASEPKNCLNHTDTCIIIYPQGCRASYEQKFENAILVEKGKPTTYAINCEQSGDLQEKITQDMLDNAVCLIVTGRVSDEELLFVLQKCRNLLTLDISGLFIEKSAATIEAEKAALKAQAAMLGMTNKSAQDELADAKRRRDLGRGTTRQVQDAEATVALAGLLAQTASSAEVDTKAFSYIELEKANKHIRTVYIPTGTIQHWNKPYYMKLVEK